MNKEHRWNDEYMRTLKSLNENLCLCHLVHHQSPMDWPRKELDLTPSRRHVPGDSRRQQCEVKVGQQVRCIVRLSHRQGDLSLLVHVAAGMTFSCLKLPVSHSLNATALAVASLNPKGDSLQTQKVAALLSHRQTGPQT